MALLYVHLAGYWRDAGWAEGLEWGESSGGARKDSLPAAVGVTSLPHPCFPPKASGIASTSKCPGSQFYEAEFGTLAALHPRLDPRTSGYLSFLTASSSPTRFTLCVGHCSTQCRSSPSSRVCRSGWRTGAIASTEFCVDSSPAKCWVELCVT